MSIQPQQEGFHIHFRTGLLAHWASNAPLARSPFPPSQAAAPLTQPALEASFPGRTQAASRGRVAGCIAEAVAELLASLAVRSLLAACFERGDRAQALRRRALGSHRCLGKAGEAVVPVWQRSPPSPAGHWQRPVAGSQPAPCSQSQRSRQPAPWKPGGQPAMEPGGELGKARVGWTQDQLQQSLRQPSREKQRASLSTAPRLTLQAEGSPCRRHAENGHSAPFFRIKCIPSGMGKQDMLGHAAYSFRQEMGHEGEGTRGRWDK